MTTTDAPDCQPKALERSVPLKRLDGIFRAGRQKSATAAEHGADRVLVGADQPDQRSSQQAFHLHNSPSKRVRSPSISIRQACLPARSARGRGRAKRSTTSQGGIDGFCRKASRAKRFTRLRKTARRANRLAMIKPRRGPPPAATRLAPSGRYSRSKCLPRRTLRLAKTAENSAAACRRCALGKVNRA